MIPDKQIDKFIQQVSEQLAGDLKQQVSLAEFNAWRSGGLAQFLYRPASAEDLASMMALIPAELPVLWLGLGSNVLVRDGGFNGLVIITQGRLKQLEKTGAQEVRAEAGLSCAQVARFCARQGLTGVEFLAGVPGTMGGALAMNAGCFGAETWSYVKGVEMMDRQGKIHYFAASDLQVTYRHVERPAEYWFIAAHLQLETGDKQTSLSKIRQLLDRRSDTQPTGDSTCGSVFRNPPGDYSGRLIEACGLKGYSSGLVGVSDKHANFIVNKGGATSTEIEQLIEYVQDQVVEKFQVELIPEVHIIGDPEIGT